MKEDALIARVERAMLIVARLLQYNELSLPIFERLENEHQRLVYRLAAEMIRLRFGQSPVTDEAAQ